MNAMAQEQQLVEYKEKKEKRTRLTRPISDFLNGFKSRNALAQDMDSFIKKDGKKGVVSITSMDLGRACGTFGTEISEAKMTAIVKYLETCKNFDVNKDIKTIDGYFHFTEGKNYVVAARKNKSQTDFAKELGITVEEVKDMEKMRVGTKQVFTAYEARFKELGIELKLKK
jgi:hypothetical protein